ncbi:MAG: hypothetical protein NT038_07990 [Euryarchaeota archaeon]|nr:hypothetical protein [Euryarchaeota archaeon]
MPQGIIRWFDYESNTGFINSLEDPDNRNIFFLREDCKFIPQKGTYVEFTLSSEDLDRAIFVRKINGQE